MGRGLDLEELPREESREREGRRKPESEPGEEQAEPLQEDHARNVAGRGPESEADSDLPRAAADGERERAAEPDGGDGEGEGCECREKRREKPRGGDRLPSSLFESAHVGHGLRRVDVVDRSLDRFRQGTRLGFGAHHEVRHPKRNLREREVDGGLGFELEPVLTDVAHDADDGVSLSSPGDSVADSDLRRSSVAHDGDRRRPRVVRIRERAAFDNWNADGAEVTGAHRVGVEERPLSFLGKNALGIRAFAPAQRHGAAQGRGRDSWHVPEVREKPRMKIPDGALPLIPIPVEVEVHREDPLGLEARLDSLEPIEASESEAGSGQKDERDRKLGDDERSPQPERRASEASPEASAAGVGPRH